MNSKLLLLFLITFKSIYCQVIPKKELSVLNKKEFQISYPPNLKIEETDKNGILFYLLSSKSNPNDNFIENINLLRQDLEKLNIDLNKYVEITEKQIGEKGKIIESKRKKGTE